MHTREKLIKTSGLMLLIVMFGLISSQAEAKDPLISVRQIQKSIDQCDYELFSAAVDVDSLLTTTINNGAKELQEALQASDVASQDMALNLVLSALSGSGEKVGAVQGLFVNEGKNFLRAAVQGGYLAGKPDKEKAGNAGLFAKGLKELGRSRKVVEPGRILSHDDKKALVTATYKDQDAGDFPLELLMQRNDQGWQVMEIKNIKSIILQASQGNL